MNDFRCNGYQINLNRPNRARIWCSRSKMVCLIIAVAAMNLTAAPEVFAVFRKSNSITSQEAYNNWVLKGADRYDALGLSYIYDPLAIDVTQFSLTIQMIR
jgi:hypothetical protein